MNNNITEDYCSFEVSKLLKEKGFDIPCYKAFLYRIALTGNDEIIGDITVIKNATKFSDSTTIKYWRPTHALAIKWIRENFQLEVESTCIRLNNSRRKAYQYIIISDNYNNFTQQGNFDKPEEATEAALLYTLKHLI